MAGPRKFIQSTKLLHHTNDDAIWIYFILRALPSNHMIYRTVYSARQHFYLWIWNVNDFDYGRLRGTMAQNCVFFFKYLRRGKRNNKSWAISRMLNDSVYKRGQSLFVLVGWLDEKSLAWPLLNVDGCVRSRKHHRVCISIVGPQRCATNNFEIISPFILGVWFVYLMC